MADDRRDRVAEGWRQIQDESQGLLRVAIIDVEDAVAHLERAAEGDVESRRLIALVNGTFDRLDGDGLVCLLCGASLSLTALPIPGFLSGPGTRAGREEGGEPHQGPQNPEHCVEKHGEGRDPARRSPRPV